MGYSCTAAASRTLHGQANSYSHGWDHNGRHYFYEIGQEQEDGAITGSIYLVVDAYCRKVGSFRIDPDGSMKRAPYGMKEWLLGGAR